MSADSGSKKRRGSATLIALAALVLVIGNFYGDLRRGQRLSESETKLEVVRSAFVAPETIQKAEKSVYLALLNGEPFGTAFVVDKARGLLATNSHIARWAGETTRLSVIGLDGVEIPVEATSLHKGYQAFPRYVGAYEPIKTSVGFAAGREIKVPALFGMVAGYDVALLQVSESHADKLADALPIAGRDDLLNLKSGDVIASVGYPLDLSSTAAIETHSLTPKATIGRISAMSSFVGVRTGDQDNNKISQLIIHPLHTQPGTSGSPMINDKGEVIAINSGASARAAHDGSVIEAGDRHGQRADMLRDLLDDTDEEAIDSLYAGLWDKQLERFERMPEIYANIIATMMSPRRDTSHADVSVRSLTFDPVSADPVYQGTSSAHILRTTVELDPAKFHLLFATDYRPGLGTCNPVFQIARSDGVFATAEGIGTNEFTIYNLQVQAGSLPPGPVPIEFHEAAGCNSVGETMRLHIYSWSPAEYIIASDEGGLLKQVQALWSGFLSQLRNALNRLT